MKKLLFIIPLVLILLNIFIPSVLGTNLKYTAHTFTSSSISPSYWDQLSLNHLSKPNPFDNFSIVGNANSSYTQHIGKNAKYMGFPFAFYVSSNITNAYQQQEHMTAISWLWAIIDALLLLLTLIGAILVSNNKRRSKNLVETVQKTNSN